MLPKHSATFISLGFAAHNLTPLFRIAPQVTAPGGNRWDGMQGYPRTRVRWGGSRGGRGRAAPVVHQMEVYVHGHRHKGGCGRPFLCWQLGIPVSCLRLALSLMKGKQKGESEKEFLIREGSYHLSASLAPERYDSSMLCCFSGGLSSPTPRSMWVPWGLLATALPSPQLNRHL